MLNTIVYQVVRKYYSIQYAWAMKNENYGRMMTISARARDRGITVGCGMF